MDTQQKTRRPPSGKKRSGVAAAPRGPGQKVPQRRADRTAPEKNQRQAGCGEEIPAAGAGGAQ